MHDLGQQIHDYFETAGPPVDIEDVIAEADRRSPARRRRRRTVIMAAAAAVAVTVAAGIVTILDGTGPQPVPIIGEDPPPAPEPPTSQPLPSRPLVWEPAELASLETQTSDGSTMYATRDDGTWFASADGLTWRILAVQAPESITTGDPDFSLGSAWRERLMFVSDVEADPQDEDAAVRVFVAHPDGSTDRTILRPDAPAFRTLRAGPVAQGAAGVIVAAEGNNADRLGDRTGWVSTDYQTWTPIPATGPFATQDGPGSDLLQLIGTDDGFVALDGEGVVWFSRDGLSWTEVGQDEALVAPDSADGVTWLLPWRGNAVAMGPSGMWSIDPSGISSLPIAGSAPAPVAGWGNVGVAAGAAGLAWTIADDSIAYSPDGIEWTRQRLPEDMGTVYAFAGPSMLVGANSLVVHAFDADDEVERVWVGR